MVGMWQCTHDSTDWFIDGTPYLRCIHTKAPHKGMKGDFERPWKERLTRMINRLAIFAASVTWVEGENTLPVWTPRSLIYLDTGMVVLDSSGYKDNVRVTSCPIVRCLHLVGLIGRSHFFDQSQEVQELRSFMFGVRRVTLLTSSAKSSACTSRISGRSFMKRRYNSGPITEPCYRLLLCNIFRKPNPQSNACHC